MAQSAPTTPYCVVSLARASANAAKMLESARQRGVALRPHVKTHKTVEGARIQCGGEPGPIVVSTLAEARAMAAAGFSDILYAAPLAPNKIAAALALHEHVAVFGVMVDSAAAVDALWEAAPTRPWNVWLKLDCGYHRAGVDPKSDSSLALAAAIAEHPRTRLAGVYVHAGMSYACDSPDAIQRVAAVEASAAADFAARVRATGATGSKHFAVAMGSTPTCSMLPSGLPGITEIHPGNYFFYDAMQARLGTCRESDIAVCVVATVIGCYPDRGEFLIDAGWTALTMQGAEHGYGTICLPGWRIKRMTQETSVVGLDGSALPLLPAINSTLRIYPWHSCVVSALYAELHLEDSDGHLLPTTWAPARGW